MYTWHNIPWFSLYDNYIDHLTTASDTLANVQSVSQLDEQNQGGAVSRSDLINPDDPPRCPRHPRSISSCVFRPCGHLACEVCLGKALLSDSKCVECTAPVVKFIGMKRPIPAVAKVTEEDGEEPEWNIQGMEDLAAAAADTNRVSVIYFAGDRVPPLHSGPRQSASQRSRRRTGSPPPSPEP
jgi:hypothetical protein